MIVISLIIDHPQVITLIFLDTIQLSMIIAVGEFIIRLSQIAFTHIKFLSISLYYHELPVMSNIYGCDPSAYTYQHSNKGALVKLYW